MHATSTTSALGIDFGTTHTVAHLRHHDNRITAQLFDGNTLLPSAVFAETDGSLTTGRDAVDSGRHNPERLELNPKRRIDDGSVFLGADDYPLEQLVAAVLSRVKTECERTAAALGPVTITVPASWGATRRLVIQDAASQAGFGQVTLVPEPVAAANHFLSLSNVSVPDGGAVVVYDFGAGTFDATVLQRQGGALNVVALDGSDSLGGLDVDQALVEYLVGQYPDEDWSWLNSPAGTQQQRWVREFFDAVRTAKERLSRQTTAEVHLPHGSSATHLTRAELDEVVAPLIRRTVRTTQGVIRASGIGPDAVAGIFLVGGSSRMPIVATTVHEQLGMAPVALEQPELAVSEGALVNPAAAASPPSPPPQAFSPPAPVEPNRPRRLRTMAAVSSVAAVAVVALVVAFVLLPGDDNGDGTGGHIDDAANSSSSDDTTESSSPSTGPDDEVVDDPDSDVVDIDQAAWNDPVLEVDPEFTGNITATTSVETASGRMFALGSQGGRVSLWDDEMGQHIGTFTQHSEEIHTIRFVSYDDTLWVLSQTDSDVYVWNSSDTGDYTEIEQDYDYDAVKWVGQYRGQIAVAEGHKNVTFRGLFTGEKIDTVRGGCSNNAGSAVVEQDDTVYVVAMFDCDDERIGVVNASDDDAPTVVESQILDETVRELGVNIVNDKAYVASYQSNGRLRLWSLDNLTLIPNNVTDQYQTVEWVKPIRLDGHVGLAWNGDQGSVKFAGTESPTPVGEIELDSDATLGPVFTYRGHPVVLIATAQGMIEFRSLAH
ncbi:Hsp70 family protein [Haloglycomyces albus]|uniref:Hsp70 family protein n=1 Tax=Haloglycomyces albus TaxID=526067 RepID=UPI00046CB8C6|nr:Hsp70 family protein [Haloglycomyces albus]